MLVAMALAAGSLARAGEPEAAEGKEAKVAVPATVPGIWAAVQVHHAELDRVVGSGKLGDVHLHAFAIRDLVAAMPRKSKGLSKGALGKLKAEVKAMRKLAADLDAAGDAGDAGKTKALMTDLDAALKRVAVIYPEGTLAGGGAVRTGVVYTCTMHPEVMSDKPGKCPKCGMTLVVKP